MTIVGPSGSGKSTLLSLLGALDLVFNCHGGSLLSYHIHYLNSFHNSLVDPQIWYLFIENFSAFHFLLD